MMKRLLKTKANVVKPDFKVITEPEVKVIQLAKCRIVIATKNSINKG